MSAAPAASPSRSADEPRPSFGSSLPRGYLVVAAVVPLVLLAIYIGLLASRAPQVRAQIGTPAPQFALSDLDGNPVRLADLRGRPVVLNFWASWCGPCVEEFPLLVSAQQRHAADGLAIVGIVYQDRSEAARDFMRQMGAGWPAAMDPGGRVATAYGVYGPPETFYIGRDGTIVNHQIGQFRANDLEQQIDAMIGKQ